MLIGLGWYGWNKYEEHKEASTKPAFDPNAPYESVTPAETPAQAPPVVLDFSKAKPLSRATPLPPVRKPKVTATVVGGLSNVYSCDLKAYNHPDGETRHAVLVFEGDEQVEVVEKNVSHSSIATNDESLIEWNGIRGYIVSSCLDINVDSGSSK